GLIDIELPGGEIIEKEQRLGALDGQIVHAHRDKVDADEIVQPCVDRQLQLGPDPVIGRDQYGILEAAGLEVEQAAKAAQRGIRADAARRFGERLDALD